MNPNSLVPIRQPERRTLAERAVSQIRDAIVWGSLVPGQRLTETVLADQLNISRSPVREALFRLESEGLVVGLASKCVWQPSVADIDDIYDLRETLILLAVRWAISSIADSDLDALRSLIEGELHAMSAGEAIPHQVLIDVDRQFFEYLFVTSGHPMLLRWWRRLFVLWAISIHCYSSRSGGCQSVTQVALTYHRALLEALRRRDLDTVRRLSQNVNRELCEQMKGILQE